MAEVLFPLLFVGSLFGGPLLGFWLSSKISYLSSAVLRCICLLVMKATSENKEEGIILGIPTMFFLFGLVVGTFTFGINWASIWEISKPYILR